MTKYEQVDYSIPWQCGLYPPPPIHYSRMRAIVCMMKIDLETKKKFLPPELEAVEFPFDTLFITEYPDSDIGPYNENLILLYCKFEGNPGLFVMNIYVDTDEAMAAGREIWGYPKKMCDINLSPIQNNKIQGTLVRKGKKIIDIEVELGDKPPGVDPSYLISSFPLINLKQFPDVEDNTKPCLKQITATTLEWNNITVKRGLTTKSVSSEYSEYDICSEVLNKADFNLGGFYVECDQVLPNGKLLKKII
ncbi:MAG: acetoacetate decarboxylase family protein [Candidatus Helarchaeota archaeon]